MMRASSDSRFRQRRFRLLPVALEYLSTGRTQFLPVLLQALLDRRIVVQLFSTKAGSVARTRLLLLRRPLVSALGEGQRQARTKKRKNKDQF
jgi:hypothetical protein